MSWLDRARKAMTDLAEGAGREVEGLRLQSQLGKLEAERDRQLLEAGKRAKILHRAGRVTDSDLSVLFERVDELEGEIEAVRAEVMRVRGEAAGQGEKPPAGGASSPDTPPEQGDKSHQ